MFQFCIISLLKVFFFIPQRKNNQLTLIEKISNIVWEGQTVEIMFASRDCVVFSIILDDL